MNDFLISIGLTFMRVFGNPTQKAEAEAYADWQKAKATPEVQKFMGSFGKAAALTFGSALASAPEPKATEVNDELTGAEIAGPNAANRR